jgi:hypothetical protein
VALALLQGVALSRYLDSVDWGTATAWLYVALFAAVGISGIWGWRGSVADERQTSTNQARMPRSN